MQKAISKYGLAAHLALLAVAPLFLFPFCGGVWTARVILWLSLSAAVWTFMEPSRRKDEMLHDARFRVALSALKDPLFWFSLLLVAISALRWLNGGVSMRYDAETAVWSLSEPMFPILPGSVSGTGYLPFATTVAVAVLLQAGRHALGKSARSCFLFIASLLAGMSAFAACSAAACGHARTLEMVRCSYADASFVGMAFGLHLMGGLVALSGAFERKWHKAMPLFALGVGGCALGLWFFSPLPVVCAFAAATVLALALTIVYLQFRLGGLAVPKCLAFVVLASLLPTLFIFGVVPAEMKAIKLAPFAEGWIRLFPDGFMEMRAALSAVAAKVFHEHPWLGTGLGSFALDIRFNAVEADWAVLKAGQVGALNGWWQVLAERGILGFAILLSPVLFLAWTFVTRAVAFVGDSVRGSFHGRSALTVHPICTLGVVATAAVAVCGFVDHSFARPETLMAVAAMLAMAGSAFPAVKEKSDGESETEK